MRLFDSHLWNAEFCLDGECFIMLEVELGGLRNLGPGHVLYTNQVCFDVVDESLMDILIDFISLTVDAVVPLYL
jgi:hypothetical protein